MKTISLAVEFKIEVPELSDALDTEQYCQNFMKKLPKKLNATGNYLWDEEDALYDYDCKL